MLRAGTEISENHRNQEQTQKADTGKKEAKDFRPIQKPDLFLSGLIQFSPSQILSYDYTRRRYNSIEGNKEKM